jgi:hypothetical protein
MAYFQTKNLDLGTFWRALKKNMMVYFIAIRNMLRPFGIFYRHLVTMWSFGIFLPVKVICTKKNLATLLYSAKYTES